MIKKGRAFFSRKKKRTTENEQSQKKIVINLKKICCVVILIWLFKKFLQEIQDCQAKSMQEWLYMRKIFQKDTIGILILGAGLTIGFFFWYHLNGYYFLYCFPVIILFLLLEYKLALRMTGPCAKALRSLLTCSKFCALPMFLVFGLGVFMPTASLVFEELSNCNIGQRVTYSLNDEDYNVISVPFTYTYNNQIQRFEGYACESSNRRSLLSLSYMPFWFYQSVSEYSSSYRFRQNKKTEIVLQTKLPSWLCSEINKKNDSMEMMNCRVNFYGDHAYYKGNVSLTKLLSFPIIMLDGDPYFPGGGLILSILFTFHPFILSLRWYFQCLRRCRNKQIAENDENKKNNNQVNNNNQLPVLVRQRLGPPLAARNRVPLDLNGELPPPIVPQQNINRAQSVSTEDPENFSICSQQVQANVA